MPLQPAPIHRRRRPSAGRGESSPFLVEENLYSSLLTGAGIMAALSTAGLLQHLLPHMRIGSFPLAGLIGLLFGWTLAVPVTRWTARRLDPTAVGQVLAVAVVSGLVWATPAAIYAPAIGWMGGALRIYLVAGVLSASGLMWGGYLDCDRLLDE